MPTSDLPVAWWTFWLIAMGVIAFAGFLWWLLQAALAEDREQRSAEHEGTGRGGVAASPEGDDASVRH